MKALTIVELDLEYYRSTMFEHARSGVGAAKLVADWQGLSQVVVANPIMPANKAVEITHPDADDNGALRWTTPIPLFPLTVRGAFFIPDEGTGTFLGNPSLLFNASGMAGNENGYAVSLTSSGTELAIIKLTAGVATTLEVIDYEWGPDELIWIEADAIALSGGFVRVRAKVWKGELGDVPSTYTIFTDDGGTDAPYDTAGWVGVYASIQGTKFQLGNLTARSRFNTQTETYRFAEPTDYLPREFDARPNIESVSLSPGAVSLGENLGTRGTMTVSFKDSLSGDRGEGFNHGTYWGKIRARFPYIENSAIRLKRGLLGQSLDEFETKHYIVQAFDGPTPTGRYTLTAQDPLKLLSGDRAQCPRISNGFLVAGINNSVGSLTLSPSGIGDAEYAASGYANIGGKEIVAFTRSGDTMTITRGQFNTTGVEHSEGDRVQQCVYFDAQRASDIFYSLCTDFGGIDPAVCPLETWNEEDDNYLQLLYTRLIPEPTRLDVLANSLIKQAGLAVGWNDEAQIIPMQVLRGIPLTATPITQDRIVKGSLSTQEQPDTRISQVWVSFGVINPLEPIDQPNNFRSNAISTDPDIETLYGSARIEKIYASWIPPFARQASERVADLILGRFARPPRRLSFKQFKYVQGPQATGNLNLLGGYRLQFPTNQDENGSMIISGAPIQIVRRISTPTEYQFEAEEMLIRQFAAVDLTDRQILIDANINNIDIPSIHNSIFPPLTEQDVIDGTTLTVTIATGVIVGSTSISLRALTLGNPSNWPPGLPITLKLNGRIQGKGGNGGRGQGETGGGVNGQNGGDALYLRFPLDIEFGPSGQIWSGGGGGGGGRTANGAAFSAGGGGGGAGTLPGNGGASINASSAQNGTSEAGGNGRNATADGGDGGDPGQDGGNGQRNPTFVTAAGQGGDAGDSIDGVSYVTITSGTPDIRGPQIN